MSVVQISNSSSAILAQRYNNDTVQHFLHVELKIGGEELLFMSVDRPPNGKLSVREE
jgi:hypothetical protein